MAESNLRPVQNFVGNEFVTTASSWIDVTDPSKGTAITQVVDSTAAEVNQIIDVADAAFPSWSNTTMKYRAGLMLKLHALIRDNADELADIIVREGGKNKTEALADVAKGNETVEYACSLPQIAQGKYLEVSGGITCRDERVPLGVVACIVPFNFPLMVPMWTVPIALVMGNCVVLKPSEKVPLTMRRVCDFFIQAGFPKGVFNTTNGTAPVVNALIDNPKVSAISFVGSCKIAEIVANRCHALHKRVISLGGAKNHLVALPDANLEQTATDVVASSFGCCGQRCMAASVLLIVDPDDSDTLLKAVVETAGSLKPGTQPGQVGPLIDKAAAERACQYLEQSESKYGSEILLDGRKLLKNGPGGGEWLGPTIVKINDPSDPIMHDEVFSPVLSVLKVKTADEAVKIENANPHGNAACVYTRSGGAAEDLIKRFRAAMLGVNVGIPVPREPFSFSGLYGTRSRFGDSGDITGDGAIEFFSTRRKVTTRWGERASAAYKGAKVADAANFNGQS